MTVSTTTNKVSYSGNGSQTVFAYTFKIFADGDLTVIIRSSTGTETTKTITTHYTVSGAGSSSGGNVTFTSGNTPASGETVVIQRKLGLTQGTDYVANDPFPAESHEDALDRLTFITQQIQEEVDRSIKASVTNTISSTEFAISATDRANKIFAFDASGDLAVTQEIGTFRGNWAASTSYNQRDLVKDTSTNNIFIVNTSHTSSGSQPLTSNANSAKYDLIVDAGSATTSQTAAGNSAADAQKLAINAEDSQFTLSDGSTTGFSALHHKEKALDAQTAAETAKTNAQGHEDTAQDWAVKTNGEAQTGEGYSAKAWATGGTGVTDSSGAGSAKEWATDTTNTCDGTEYSAKEYAIGSQSGNTNGSAKQWALGGGSSYSSTTTVDGTNYSARYWAEKAESYVQQEFENKYLGAHSSDPTQDPYDETPSDSQALDAGDLYFNTTNNILRVYDGANWNDAVQDTTGFATAGFSIAMSIAL